MTPPCVQPNPVRIVRQAEAAVRPLYPPARLLKSNLLNLEDAVNAAREELVAAQGELARLRDEFAVEIGQRRAELAAEAEQLRREACEQGCLDGRTAFADLLVEARQEGDRFRERFAGEVEQLAFRLARTIVNTEFAVRPEAIIQLTAQVLERARFYQQITVVLHPDDLNRVRPHESELIENLIHCERLEFRADPSLPPHSVRLETNRGVLEKVIDEQFAQMASRLFGGESEADFTPAVVETRSCL